MGLRNRSAVKSFRGDRKGSKGGGEGAEGGRSPNSSSAASRLRSHVLTALQQQLIRIAAVRNTNVPCRNLSAQDLSDATYIAHSPYMENIVSRRVDGGDGLHSALAACLQDAHFLVWHDYFRRKQRSRRKTKHRTNAIISIHEGGGASQTDGCISVSISGKPPLMHQRGGFTTLREATVHAMKDELRPFQRVGMNLSERNGTAQPLIRR